MSALPPKPCSKRRAEGAFSRHHVVKLLARDFQDSGGLSYAQVQFLKVNLSKGSWMNGQLDTGDALWAVPWDTYPSQVLIEEVESALQGKLGGSLVVTRRCVVMEAVIRAFVDITRVGHVIGFQRSLVRGPLAGDTRVKDA
jgi:hypothetical protein